MRKLKPKNGRLSLYIGLLAGVAIIMILIKQCSRPSYPTEDIPAGGDTINVAIELSPTGVTTSGDSLSGFHYELINAIAKVGKRPLKISGFTNLASAMRGLDEGRYDVVVSDIPATSRVKESYILTTPLYVDHQVLVRRIDENNQDFDHFSLANDTVWIPAGSPYIDRIINLSHEIGDTIYVREDPEYGSEQLVILTSLGEIKQAVVNDEIARRIAIDYPNIDISNSISFNQFQSWILSPDNKELADSLDCWINRYEKTEEFEKLKRKYFNDFE